MDPILWQELRNFLISMGYGVAIVILYDGYRVLRILWKHSVVAVAAEDFLFWLLTGCMIFHLLYQYNNGEARFSFFLGIWLGMLSYYCTISKMFLRAVKTARKKVKNILKYGDKTDKMIKGSDENNLHKEGNNSQENVDGE
ncbi:MAG: spore cortex biosynthesis protein YabQ [Lachnospiraceae bacterium]